MNWTQKRAIIISVPIALVCGMFYLSQSHTPNSNDRTVTLGHTVTLSVVDDKPGEKFAHLTYTNESGGTEQNVAVLPWKLELGNQKAGSFEYISAQKEAAAEGNYDSITVSIYVDGVLVKEASTAEDYGIATVSGSVP